MSNSAVDRRVLWNQLPELVKKTILGAHFQLFLRVRTPCSCRWRALRRCREDTIMRNARQHRATVALRVVCTRLCASHRPNVVIGPVACGMNMLNSTTHGSRQLRVVQFS